MSMASKTQVGVILDTNIYLGGFYLSPEKTQAFQRFLGVRAATLLVPSVVDLEVRNRFKQTVKDDLHTIAKSRLSHFNLIEIPKAEQLEKQLNTLYQNFISSVQHEKIDCSKLNIETLIEKAVVKHKPFDNKGRGFQDAMIWQALIHYLQQNEGREAILVTGNSKDFGVEGQLDESLLRELEKHALGGRVQYFNSLNEFLTGCAQPSEFIDESFIRRAIDEHVNESASQIPPSELEIEIGRLQTRESHQIASSFYINQYSIDGYYILEESDGIISLAVEFVMDFIVNLHIITRDDVGEIEDVDHRENLDAQARGSCILEVDKEEKTATVVSG